MGANYARFNHTTFEINIWMRRAYMHHRMTSSNGNMFRVTGHLPAQRPVTRSFDVLFDLGLNKQLTQQSWGRWFETLSRPLWRRCNEWTTSSLFQVMASWRTDNKSLTKILLLYCQLEFLGTILVIFFLSKCSIFFYWKQTFEWCHFILTPLLIYTADFPRYPYPYLSMIFIESWNCFAG